MKTIKKEIQINWNGESKNIVLIKKLIETDKDFNLMIEDIKDSIKIAIDTENGNGEIERGALNPKYAIPAGFSLSINGKVGYYIPVNHKDIKTDFIKRFNEILINKKLIIMWNSVYDGAIFKQHYNNDLYDYKWYDVMIAQHLLDAFQSKGLKYNTERYFKLKQNHFEWKDACKTKAVDIFEYACDDAIYTYLHYLRTKEEIKKQKLSNLLLNIEGEFLKVLARIKLNGFSFDSEKAKQIENKLIKDKIKLINKILKVTPQIGYIQDLLGGKKPNINLDSSKDLTKLLYDKLNLPIKSTTKSGAPATDAETFKLMKDNFGEWLHPICPLLIKYKEIQKLLSAYTKSLYEKVIEGKIYGDLLDHGTESGRLSAKNPNLQQLPKNDTYEIRSLFIASKGYKLMVSDFGQEELRIAGVLTKDPSFIEAFSKGQDLHLKVANECYNLGIPNECLVESHKDYKIYKDKFYKQRFNSKSINFGLLYGRTAHGLAPQLDLSVEEAQEIVNNYFKTFPNVKKAMDLTNREIKVQGFVRNIYGRKRRFNKIIKGGKSFYSPSALRQGFNHKIQGSCADILRIVMVECDKYIRKQPENQIRILTTIHDEIVFEIKNDANLKIHAKALDDIMQNTIKLPIKLKTDYDIGINYGETK